MEFPRDQEAEPPRGPHRQRDPTQTRPEPLGQRQARHRRMGRVDQCRRPRQGDEHQVPDHESGDRRPQSPDPAGRAELHDDPETGQSEQGVEDELRGSDRHAEELLAPDRHVLRRARLERLELPVRRAFAAIVPALDTDDDQSLAKHQGPRHPEQSDRDEEDLPGREVDEQAAEQSVEQHTVQRGERQEDEQDREHDAVLQDSEEVRPLLHQGEPRPGGLHVAFYAIWNSLAQRSRNSASIFVRSSSVAISMYSSALCARLPRGPMPSRVGAMAEVWLPSEPPPVLMARTSTPSSRPAPRMISSSRSVPGKPGGHGGKLTSPEKRAVVPATWGWAQIICMAAMAASASARLHARRSISPTARSATTLGRSPPRTVPTLTVVPRSRSVSACNATTFCARSDGTGAQLGLQPGVRGLAPHLQEEA